MTTKLDIASRILSTLIVSDHRNREDVHKQMRKNVDLAVQYTLMLMKRIPEKVAEEEPIDWSYRPKEFQEWVEKGRPVYLRPPQMSNYS